MKRKIIHGSVLTRVASFAQDTLFVQYYDYKGMPANRYHADLLHMALRETESQDGLFNKIFNKYLQPQLTHPIGMTGMSSNRLTRQC
ncbi:MAG TPA: hypothetical protein VKA08_04755 [Balneolales bacterium]|jgi:hypothetical protein|nr:hypothetical protein [Balneolales bacterium]